MQPNMNNKNQSTLLNNIDYNNAKLIEDSLKETEILQPMKAQDFQQEQAMKASVSTMNQQQQQLPPNLQNMPPNAAQNVPFNASQLPPNLHNMPSNTPINSAQNLTNMSSNLPPPSQEPPSPPQQLSATSKLKGLLPSLDKYNLKYPAFLFQQVNVKKLILLVVLCIAFQLPFIRNAMINNLAKFSSNEILPSLILGLLNAATYMTVINCINFD